uniref:Reverse transcriptase domain-containing protein n=1 Tax=Tanacetum cinerariifolium TaxID=118510 RepID=A0A6L2LN22_TANCI|nr:hypothetical protein [Tanacetum cinerariifolium]
MCLFIDSLLDEFAGELIFLKPIPPGIDEVDCDPKKEIRLIEKLLYDNSSPHPLEEFNSENSDVVIESFSPSHIPFEDSDPFIEEINLFLTSDGSIPPGIDSDYSDSEGDNLFQERLLHGGPIPLSDILDSSNVVQIFPPLFTYPVTSCILLSSGSEDIIFDPGISDYHFSSLEPDISHRSGTFMKFNAYPNHLKRGLNALWCLFVVGLSGGVSGGVVGEWRSRLESRESGVKGMAGNRFWMNSACYLNGRKDDTVWNSWILKTRARGFVLRSLDLHILCFIFGILYPNLID